MQVMLIKNHKLTEQVSIPKGQTYQVRPMTKRNVIGTELNYFQIIDVESPWSGELLPAEYCLEQPKVKTYTEKEWNDMENYYMHKLNKAEDGINIKMREIQVLKAFVKMFADHLIVAHEKIDKLRELKKE